ncbi:MAG TPA: aminotransferase class III-fold pyridoxal phosphate-dependent enzyme, partial [Anaerolineales bacterium]|nr:aminotransferase class III-fold pyridoxal phosphate-dependent enzyme [Anaerolineales bacterium]
LAVLDVIEAEGLQEHACEVGGALKSWLREIADHRPLIGDVRGLGLFLGVELVRDHETLEPAAEEAAGLVQYAKDRGVLLGVDGPLHNVLKIKPPLPFTHADAERLVEVMEEGLRHLRKTSLKA